MTDDLIEAVARAMCERVVGQGASSMVTGQRVENEWHLWINDARAAIRAAAPLILDMAEQAVAETPAGGDVDLAIRQLKEGFQ